MLLINAISNYLGRYSTPRRLQRIDPGAFYAVDSSVLGPLRLIPGPFTRSEPTRRATKHTWGLARNGIACATAMDHDQQTRRNTITSNPPTLIHSRSFQKRRPFPGQKSIGTVGQNSIGADTPRVQQQLHASYLTLEGRSRRTRPGHLRSYNECADSSRSTDYRIDSSR